MPTLAQKVAYWERELLDLSKHNRIFHFRETKRSSLVIEKPDFFSMYQSIVPEYQTASDVRYLSSEYPVKYSEYMKRILLIKRSRRKKHFTWQAGWRFTTRPSMVVGWILRK